MEESHLLEMRNRFNSSLCPEKAKANSFMLTKKKYNSILNRVIRIKATNKKECTSDYRVLKRYDSTVIDGCEKLIKPITARNPVEKIYVTTDEIFDILYSTHIAIGHGGRNRMVSALSEKYANINQCQVNKFLSVCDACVKKREKVSKQTISSLESLKSRCQVELIDFESQPDGNYKFLLVYKDYSSKFVVLKSLTSLRTDEVCENILDILLLFGAPAILQSDIGEEFCTSVIQNLKFKSPELKMVSGKSGHDLSQDGQLLTKEIRSMLNAWMKDNKTNKWSTGAKFVQFMKNKSYDNEIRRTPFEAMFGHPAKYGLASFSIPGNLINKVDSEDDLNKLLTKLKTELVPCIKEEI